VPEGLLRITDGSAISLIGYPPDHGLSRFCNDLGRNSAAVITFARLFQGWIPVTPTTGSYRGELHKQERIMACAAFMKQPLGHVGRVVEGIVPTRRQDHGVWSDDWLERCSRQRRADCTSGVQRMRDRSFFGAPFSEREVVQRQENATSVESDANRGVC
jgi:hypothetical protein